MTRAPLSCTIRVHICCPHPFTIFSCYFFLLTMNTLRILLACAVALALNYAPQLSQLHAQILVDPTIITFDKLTKTIIPFQATQKPTVKIEPNIEGQNFALNLKGNEGTLTFSKPVPAGDYTISYIYPGLTVKTAWKVLKSELDPKYKSIRYLKFYYGKRISLRSQLPAEAELPLQQFKIDYQIGNEPKVQDNAYSESWVGPNVPASAKSVKYAIVWVYPVTGERVPLFSAEVRPEQTPPDITSSAARAEYKVPDTDQASSNRQSTTFDIVIKGIDVDFEVPIDADNSTPNASKSIRATLGDVEAEEVTIDYSSPETVLRVYNGDEIDKSIQWKPTDKTLRIVKGQLDFTTGGFSILIRAELPTIIPNESRILRGTVALNVQAKIVNRRAGVSAVSSSPQPVVTINIPYISPTPRVSTSASTGGVALPETEPEQDQTDAAEKRSKGDALRADALCKDCTSDAARRSPVWSVKSTALREQLQRFMLALGRKLPPESLTPTAEVILQGEAKKNGRYSLVAIRIGKEVATRQDINNTMLMGWLDILQMPFSENGERNYAFEVLPANVQEQERLRIAELAIQSGAYAGRSVLRRIDNYRFAGYAIYEVDAAVARRLRETITPGLARSPALDIAEQECTNTDDIKKRISKKQPVPTAMIDEGGSPQDCQAVLNYYTALASLVRIGSAYIVVNERLASPKIIGLVSTIAVSETTRELLRQDIHSNLLSSPISSGVLDSADLVAFPTYEYEKDGSTGKYVPVRGSMEETRTKNLYEYLSAELRAGRLADRTADVMPFPSVRNAVSVVPISTNTSTKAIKKNRAKSSSKKPTTGATSTVSATASAAASALTHSSVFTMPDVRNMQELRMWSVCDAALQARIREQFTKAGKKGAEGEIVVVGPVAGSGYPAKARLIFCGSAMMNYDELLHRFSQSLLENVSLPFIMSDSGTSAPLYCHKLLTLQQELDRYNTAQNVNTPMPIKEALKHLPDYADANISLLEADAAVVQRFRLTFTPTPERTPSIKTAEQECSITDDIKHRIAKKQFVSEAMIEGSSSPSDCEKVRAYYQKVATMRQIGKVYVVTEQYQSEKKVQNILGVVAIENPASLQMTDSEFLPHALSQPLLVMDAKELAAMKTKEYAKDEETGAMITTRGSIEGTESKTMLEHLKTTLGSRADYIWHIRHRGGRFVVPTGRK